jgi:hypothetical protein
MIHLKFDEHKGERTAQWWWRVRIFVAVSCSLIAIKNENEKTKMTGRRRRK